MVRLKSYAVYKILGAWHPVSTLSVWLFETKGINEFFPSKEQCGKMKEFPCYCRDKTHQNILQRKPIAYPFLRPLETVLGLRGTRIKSIAYYVLGT